MPAPVNRTGRIELQYVVDGLPHSMFVNVRNIQVGGTSFRINTRATDSNDLNWEDAADGLAESVSYLMGSAAVAGNAVLEELSGVTWVPKSVHATSLTHKTGSYGPAAQWTQTMRDKLFYIVKVQLMEPAVGVPFRTVGLYGTTSGWRSCQIQFTKDFTVTNAPWNWMVGLSDQYLLDDPIIAATATLNRKERKRRGFA